jgi:SAM-dependent methyltransferase
MGSNGSLTLPEAETVMENEMKPVPGVDGEQRLRPPIWEYNYYLMTLLRRAIVDQISKRIQPRSGAVVVDFGCGSRPYEPLFKHWAARYIGVDLDDNARADVVAVLGKPLPFADSSADFVLSTQVLEHVLDVDAYLDECLRLLRPDGILLLTTHGFWTYHPYPTDVRRWTCQGLPMEIEKHGFTVEEVQGCLGPLAYTTQVRLQLIRGALYQVGRIAWPIIACISAPSQLVMMLEDALTPHQVRQENSAVYVVAARKTTKSPHVATSAQITTLRV